MYPSSELGTVFVLDNIFKNSISEHYTTVPTLHYFTHPFTIHTLKKIELKIKHLILGAWESDRTLLME